DRLKAASKVYFYWPGLGDEAPDPAVNSLDDLVAMVEREAGEGPVDLLAQSMGGVVALRVALEIPEAVRRLVLVATSGGIDAARTAARLYDWRESYRRNYPNAARWIVDDTTELTGRVGEIAAPALLLFGDADPIAPPSVGERLARLMPDAHLEIIRGADHDLVLNHIDEALPLIEAHLS
ncbi:MAG: alpha/beta fold hydrolase, partial [Caulobacteraceae bacterium]